MTSATVLGWAVFPPVSPTYEQGRAMLESLLQSNPVFSGDTTQPVPCNTVVFTPDHRVASQADALAFDERRRAANRALDCDFFEGGR